MGLRLYRRLNILPGLSLNLSGSGLSASFGPRGAKLTVGPRGVFSSLGLPGTGISYRQKLRSPDGKPVTRRASKPFIDPAKLTPEAIDLMQAVVDGKDGVTVKLNTSEEVLAYWEKVKCVPGAFMVNPETGRRMNDAQVRAFAKKVDREAAIKKLAEEIALEEAKLHDAVRYWHPLPQIPEWQSYVDEYENLLDAPFPEQPPAAPAPPLESQAWTELVERERAKQVVHPWLARWFPKWAEQKADAKAKELWPAHWADLEAKYRAEAERFEGASKQFVEREADWRSRCAQEAGELYALLSGEDKEALMTAACGAVDDMALPFEADAKVFLDDDTSIFVDIDLPEIENVVPATKREVSASGGIKQAKRTGTDMNDPYAELVFGHCLNLVAKIFTELPRLQTATLAAYTRRDKGDEYVLQAAVTREAMATISRNAPGTLVELVSALALTNAVYELQTDSQLKAIDRPEWTNNRST